MAAGGSDGSLRFDTAINIDGFEDGISTLSKAMDRLTKAVDRLSTNILNRFNGAGQAMAETASSAESTSDAVETIGDTADKSAAQVKSLQEQMDAISVHDWQDNASDVASSAPVAVPVSEKADQYNPEAMVATFGEAAAEIERWAGAVAQYGAQAGSAMNALQQDAASVGQATADAVEEEAASVEQEEKHINRFRIEIENLKAQIANLESQGMYFGDKEYDTAYRSLKNLEAELGRYKKKVMEQKEYVSFKDSVLNAFKGIPIALSGIPKAVATQVGKVPGIVKGAFSSAARIVTGFGKTLGKGLANKAKQAVSSLKGLGKSSNKASQCVFKLANMFKLMLIRMAMRAAIQGVKEGMQNLVQYSDSANQSMSNLMSGMTYLKNSFAAAFAPILSIVAPVLNTLINLLATAVGYINQFFSALGGGSTFVRAKKANEDYAASLKKTGGAASAAGKEAKKALAPFDDLVQIQQQSADDSGGGGGGANPSDMFETVGIDQGISDFANKLKEMFAAGDWEGIGQLIGQKINEAVQSFTEFISWDNVGAQITTFVTAFTTLFNSLVATIDWYAIGIMFGTGINTLAATLFMLLTQIDWFMLGNALGVGLMGMVDTVDWNLFGATIGAYFQAKISGLLGFVLAVDWGSIGAAIATCLMGLTGQIDWAQLGYLFAAGLNAAFALLGEFAVTFNWIELGTQIASSLSTFFQTFDWIGAGTAVSDFVLGLLNAFITFMQQTDWSSLGQGLADALKSVDWWGVFVGVVDSVVLIVWAVIQTLGPTLVDLAKFLWEGFCNGIKEFFADPGAFIKQNITDPFVKHFKELLGIHSPSTVMAGMGQYLWDGFCNGIKEFFSDPSAFIKANITDPFVNGIKKLLGIHSPSTVLAGIGSNTVAGFNQGVTNEQTASQSVIKSWATGVSSWFKDKFGISSGDSTESKQWATNILSGFNNSITKNYTKSQSVMETWAENIRKWFVGTDETQGINELSWTKFADTIIQAFKTKIDDSHTETQSSMETWAKNIKEWFWGDSDLEGTGGMYAAFKEMARRINEGFADGITEFAYMAKDAIRKWASDAMKEAREEFDINSPSKKFYSIAEYVVRGFNNGISAMAASSRSTVQKWLDGVMDVFDGVEIQLPIGINIPNAASYLPRMASGTVVPPRAGEMSTSMRNMAGYGQEETLSALIAEMNERISRLESEGNRPIQIVLNLTGNLAALARVLKPELDKEAARKGVSLVIVGG